jgi:hypothetical protein
VQGKGGGGPVKVERGLYASRTGHRPSRTTPHRAEGDAGGNMRNLSLFGKLGRTSPSQGFSVDLQLCVNLSSLFTTTPYDLFLRKELEMLLHGMDGSRVSISTHRTTRVKLLAPNLQRRQQAGHMPRPWHMRTPRS